MREQSPGREREQQALLAEWIPVIREFIKLDKSPGVEGGLSEVFSPEKTAVSDFKIDKDDQGMPAYRFKLNGSPVYVAGDKARRLEDLNRNN